MSKTIDMTPTWGATLRIYGLALRNPDLDGAGEKNAFDGLMEAANHLDKTYPERCKGLKEEIENLKHLVETFIEHKSIHAPEVQEQLKANGLIED